MANGKGGRPPAEFDLKEVEKLASRGLSIEQIANALGYTGTTFYEHKGKNPELAEAWKRGKAKGVAVMANAMFEQGKAGNSAAMIFWMKNNAGWRDKVEHVGEDGGPIQTRNTVKIIFEHADPKPEGA